MASSSPPPSTTTTNAAASATGAPSIIGNIGLATLEKHAVVSIEDWDILRDEILGIQFEYPVDCKIERERNSLNLNVEFPKEAAKISFRYLEDFVDIDDQQIQNNLKQEIGANLKIVTLQKSQLRGLVTDVIPKTFPRTFQMTIPIHKFRTLQVVMVCKDSKDNLNLALWSSMFTLLHQSLYVMPMKHIYHNQSVAAVTATLESLFSFNLPHTALNVTQLSSLSKQQLANPTNQWKQLVSLDSGAGNTTDRYSTLNINLHLVNANLKKFTMDQLIHQLTQEKTQQGSNSQNEEAPSNAQQALLEGEELTTDHFLFKIYMRDQPNAFCSESYFFLEAANHNIYLVQVVYEDKLGLWYGEVDFANYVAKMLKSFKKAPNGSTTGLSFHQYAHNYQVDNINKPVDVYSTKEQNLMLNHAKVFSAATSEMSTTIKVLKHPSTVITTQAQMDKLQVDSLIPRMVPDIKEYKQLKREAYPANNSNGLSLIGSTALYQFQSNQTFVYLLVTSVYHSGQVYHLTSTVVIQAANNTNGHMDLVNYLKQLHHNQFKIKK